MLTPLAKELIAGANYATVATITKDGSIHQSVVWVGFRGEDIVFSTVLGRAKYKHLAANPTVSLLVIDKDNPYRWVSISGVASFDDVEADVLINDLSHKYTGEDFVEMADTARVNITVNVTRTFQYPPA